METAADVVEVQVAQDGSFTLPADVRERYHITPGKTLRVLDLGGILVLVLADVMITDPAKEIERDLREAGLSMDEMLASLREERERYDQEKYSSKRT